MDNLEISNISEIMNPHHSGEITAMLADFKHSIDEYLKELESSPVKSLADIIAFNEKNSELVICLNTSYSIPSIPTCWSQ